MSEAKTMEWVLRVAVAGEFVGHGMLAIGQKADWVGWISKLTGASTPLATQLLVAVGVLDLLTALIILLRPVRIVLLWAAFWGFWTALVRPIVGVGWLDFIERWTNWGAPLALLLLMGWPKKAKEWVR